jgi:hypothetical protein
MSAATRHNRPLSLVATSSLKSLTPVMTRAAWDTPSLQYRGTVGEVLRSGGGKLSIAGADPGEMRCEKPHSASCSAD